MRYRKTSGMTRAKRALLLILTVCFVTASILTIRTSAEISAQTTTFKNEDYRKWAQGDARWGGIQMGASGKTVAKIGCLVTSITKLIIQSGFRDSSSFNVGTLVMWLNNNGGFSSVGNLIWDKPAQLIEGMEFYGMDYAGGDSSSSAVQNKILNYIRDGYHVVLNVKNGGHWIAVDSVKSLSNGKVYIMDSLNNVAENADVTLTSRYPYVSRICMYEGSAPSVNPTPTQAPTPTPTPAQSYIDQCDYEMVRVNGKVTKQNATMYSQPCASGNGSSATGTAATGSVLDISAQIVNTNGEKWYQVEGANAQNSYISISNIEFAGFVNDLEIISSNPPSGNMPQGSAYSLTERVISRHRITKVTGRFTNENGSIIKTVTFEPNTRGYYNISSSSINSQLKFGELPAGHYNYEMIAEVTADSNLTSETKIFRTVFVSPFSIGMPELENHTVSFIDQLTGQTIATQTVAHGFYPVLIDAPEHEGYIFSNWIGAGQRVYSDIQITAVYASGVNGSGDVDGSGAITVTDALLILRYAIGTTNDNSDIMIGAADVNGDGVVTVTDALSVLRSVIM